jgi:hypothetical protein
MVDPVKCRVDVEGDVFTRAYERSGIERWKQTQVQLWKQKQSHKELTITCPMRWPPKTIFQDGEYKLVMVQDEEMLKRIKELQSEKMANEARRKQEIEGREEHIMMRSGTRAGRIVRANGPRNPAAAEGVFRCAAAFLQQHRQLRAGGAGAAHLVLFLGTAAAA